MTRVAIIGGSGLERLLEGPRKIRAKTRYGQPAPISVGRVGSEEVAFLPRHGPKHDLPPHKVNYRANLSALKRIGVERIIATNAVGAINSEYNPGELVVPTDILDFTKSRASTFFDSAPVTHVDVSEPFCPELRSVLIKAADSSTTKVWSDSIIAATEGPRYETPAEIKMIESLGGDVVGMTTAPEVFLARELEVCYSAICFISNRAAGKQERLSAVEVTEAGTKAMTVILDIITASIGMIPNTRKCPCVTTISQAQV